MRNLLKIPSSKNDEKISQRLTNWSNLEANILEASFIELSMSHSIQIEGRKAMHWKKVELNKLFGFFFFLRHIYFFIWVGLVFF
jgi:hypothetical protein